MTSVFISNGAAESPWHLNGFNQIGGNNRASGHIYINTGSNEHVPAIYALEHEYMLVFGTPAIDGKIVCDAGRATELVSRLDTSPEEVDSVFVILLYSKSCGSCRIITDRFGFFTIYYSQTKYGILFSTCFQTLTELLKSVGDVTLNKSQMFEFLWFRRLYGNKTYVDQISVIAPASILKTRVGKISSEMQYWTPKKAEVSGYSTEDYVSMIASSLTDSVNMLLSNDTKPGLMLSGGLDSRALLAIGKERYISITNTVQKNNEFEIASRLAELVGSEHHHLKRPINYLDQIIGEALKQSNGSTIFYECQFLGYIGEILSLVSELHLGLFLDIFFCGHYMPKKHPKFGSRHALFFLMDRLPNQNLSTYFMNNVSYRQKNTNLEMMMSRKTYSDNYSFLRSKIDDIFNLADDNFSDIERWEYCHLTNIGRHYSSLMASSLLPYMRVSLPALTIDNYNLAFSLPVEKKKNWSVYIQALNKLDGRMMAVRNSNTNIRAGSSLYSQTAIKVLRGLYNVVSPGAFITSPEYQDRSWPSVKESIIHNPEVRSMIEQTIEQGRIMDIGLVNKKPVKKLYEMTLLNEQDHSIFLNQLLTLEYGLLNYL